MDGNAGPRLEDGRGLVVLRDSRLERLLEHLHLLLEATRPERLLEAQTVIAAHPGMRPWITGQLARKAGPGGVVANVDVVLASHWLDTLAQARLGQRAIALPRYRRGPLTWTLHALLDADAARAAGVSDARVRAYLAAASGEAGEADRARRRYQLAERLAGLFQQYLVYRPDWLGAWQAGRFDAATRTAARLPDALHATECELLGPLWRATRARLGPHRAELLSDLRGHIARDGAGLSPLHVFGVAHLPPLELALLREVAMHTLVVVYAPDPCREYWGGLAANDLARSAFLHEEQLLMDAAGDGEYWHAQGHPLLARWGRMGQQFLAVLGEGAVKELGDSTGAAAADADATSGTRDDRLGRLQESLRALDPARLREDPARPDARADASLRVHACHTRLRELEVLRDAILDAIEHDGLAPGDVVVMAPDMAAYAPLVPAVFGATGDARAQRLPYHLADLPPAGDHRLRQAFAQLLALPGQRIALPALADLLALPEVQRRFGLDADDLLRVQAWLHDAGAAWGLDAAHRAGFGVPAIEAGTHAWAVDRLVAGYLLPPPPAGQPPRAVTLPDGTQLLPLPGADGPGAEALGALDALLREVQAWRRLGERTLPVSQWVTQLRQRLDALWLLDPDDAEARVAHAGVLRALGALARDTAEAGEDPRLPFGVVADVLQAALDAVPERQRFLTGGITFCGMVPQRAIPFGMVCVLGLDEGAFPRARHDAGLDLMRRLRRVGDRDPRDDDRYLFLETVMAARRRLHLSWCGQSVADNRALNPAAPLAELLLELDRAAGLEPHDTHTARPWIVVHPLHPFDARYGDGRDPALFAYREGAADLAAPEPLPAATAASVPSPWPAVIPLAAAQRYWRDPARELLEGRLGLSFAAFDAAQWRESEALDARFEALDRVPVRVFFEHLERRLDTSHCAVAEHGRTPPDWLRHGGLWPPGAPGEHAWHMVLEQRDALDAALRAHPELHHPRRLHRDGVPLEVAIRVPGDDGHASVPVQVQGRTREVLERDDGGWCLLRAAPQAGKSLLKPAAQLHFGERVPLFLDWALLRLATAAPHPVRAAWLAQGEDAWLAGLNRWDAHWCEASAPVQVALCEGLAARVAWLLARWHDAAATPLRYLPRSSWAVRGECDHDADVGDDSAAEAARCAEAATAAWAGNPHQRGERDHSEAARRLADADVFAPGSAALALLCAHARALDACLSLDAEAT